jgi:sugar phosphate isomerase/epimerase
MRSLIFLVVLLTLSGFSVRSQGSRSVFAKDNLVAWCVVPFDKIERTPEQRAMMLKELGFKQFAYDWRAKHLATFPDEIKALKNNNIKLASVWLWLEPQSSGQILDSLNEKIFKIVKENNVHTDFWIGISNNNFEGLDESQKMEKALMLVKYLDKRAADIGCTISLYNHGDWFGEPLNQVKIIKAMDSQRIGIVYNFHHAHLQIKEFPQLLKEMLPWLRTVNLNGMKVEGPKIMTIGQGDQELEMLQTLKTSGYKGTIGIICHIEDEDAKVVLARNIEGLKSLLKKMDEQKALRTY